MSKQVKQGFTLIELMVVIVIIGILAAIAIPKLFGMSAKAKAQEVGPTTSTWIKLQQAYNMEKGVYGSNQDIGYKLPGGTSDSTVNFKYAVTGTTGNNPKPKFTATSLFNAESSAEGCSTGKEWSAEMDTIVVTKMVAACKPLTPNFCGIGDNGETNCLAAAAAPEE